MDSIADPSLQKSDAAYNISAPGSFSLIFFGKRYKQRSTDRDKQIEINR
jgi:hypothetical protein